VVQARAITDGMFAAAARRLAEEIHDEDLAAGSLFPPVSDIRRVTRGIAEAVAAQALREGVGDPVPGGDLAAAVATEMWFPAYLPYLPGSPG
jgi:malate dehydrogenase (oxaloacetate-decarboxylating)